MSEYEVMRSLTGLTLGFGVIIFVIAFLFYILFAFGLYTLAKNNGYEDKAFFAFIPILNKYLFGLMSGDANIFGNSYISANTMGILLMALPMLTALPFIGFFICIPLFILTVYSINNLYKRIDSNNATLMTVLSFFMPIISAIYLFIKRNTILTEYQEVYEQNNNYNQNYNQNNNSNYNNNDQYNNNPPNN